MPQLLLTSPGWQSGKTIRILFFLHYNAFNIRKGFLEVFKAFNKAFAHDEPVKLIFKTTIEHQTLPIIKSEYPNIEIIRGKFSDADLVNLLHTADCFVYPSRGEGFGMTPLEAMATGIPAIVPNAHGITEYFNPDFMYEAKVAETCPGIYSRYKNQDVGNMVVCDIDQLAQQMRYIYEHQEEAREKGRKAAEYVKQWTFAKTGELLKQYIDQAEKLDLSKRPIKNILKLEGVR
jgi:glycosyltransferase involved in cell wall biosynthesis